MEKLDLLTPDFTAANIDKVAVLFPNCLTETRDDEGNVQRAIDFDLLKQELNREKIEVVEGASERYRLDWPGKKQALAAANTPIDKTLRPARHESVDFDTTQNLYIEGDNLDALKLLQETYLGKVKMIYIDPPYNTGKDFIYSDKFTRSAADELLDSGQTDEDGNRLVANTESNGRFHSDWLSMIYPRLKLARNLLKDDGVIFISIDDNEVHNLRKICDEVFGEENFVANVIWEKKYTRANDARWFSDNHDHVLCYIRDKSTTTLNLLPRNGNQIAAYSNPDNHPKGPWKATPLHAKSGTNNNPYEFSNKVSWNPPTGTYRRFNDASMQKMDQTNEIWFGSDGSQTPNRKSFLCDVKDGVTPVTIWPYSEAGHNHEANTEIKKLSLSGLFSNPKPTRLISRCINLACSPTDIILDFFSGSATTAHAVMQLNADDGGKRRHIMVQLPEICDEKSAAAKAGYATIAEIGKERIRRAGKKVLQEWQEKQDDKAAEAAKAEAKAKKEASQPELPTNAGKMSDSDLSLTENCPLKTENSALTPPDVGFRVLKIASSTYADVHKRPDEVSQDDLISDVENLKPDRTPEDLLFQVLLDWGVDLALPIHSETLEGQRVFFVGGDEIASDAEALQHRRDAYAPFVGQAHLAACFEPKLSEAAITAIAKRQPLRVVFRDSSFADDAAKINATQLFTHHAPHTEIKTL